MKHLNLLLFASSMMFVAPAYGQDYKQVWADEFNNVGSVDESTWNFETGNYKLSESQRYRGSRSRRNHQGTHHHC